MTLKNVTQPEVQTGPSITDDEGKGLTPLNAINEQSGGGRDNTARGNGNENDPNTAANAAMQHLGEHGEGRKTGPDGGTSGDDSPVDVTAIVERFQNGARARLKPDTIAEYATRFGRFASAVNLDGITRRQLAGAKGKDIIIGYLNQHRRPSWRYILAMLKTVWAFGINLPFPINTKVDIGKLPRIRREESPPDDVIKQWADALKHEPVVYFRLLWLFIAQHGWRPSQAGLMKWRNIRYDGNGKPVAIVADGGQEGFKTASPVAARLSPDVVDALIEWSARVTDRLPESNILMIQGHPLKRYNVEDAFVSMRKKWNLPKLRPKDLRHWVSTTSRKVGLSKQATAYLLGHDAAAGGAMRDWYDNPQMADVFDEQSAKLPRGPLGVLDPPEVKIVEGLPEEAVGLLRAYLNGQMGTLEFSGKIEALRMKQTAKAALVLTH